MKGDSESTLNLVETNYPGLSDLIIQIRMYLTEKLYHELTGSLITLMSDKNVSCDDKIQVFETVVHPLKDSLNTLKFCTLLRLSSESLDPRVALEHLCKYDKFMEKETEAFVMLQIAKSYHYVKSNQMKECDTLLDSVKEIVTNTMGLDISVHSSYYHASAFMNKACKNYSQCYKDSIMYLAYTSLNDISDTEKTNIAITLTISAIIAPDCFGFGELIHQPIIETQLKGDHQWLHELLHIFNEGHLQLFDDALERHKGKIVHTELNGHESQLKYKLTLIALLNLAFRKPNKQRCVTFQEIVEHCNIQLNEVEPFILKALACKLIKGSIDHIQEVLRVTWVQPRILDSNKLEFVRQRLKGWITSTNELVSGLEQLSSNAAG
ncbi:26S proteasome subunit, putative [Theileria equi strain WA]|uniref:26S proteasome subunit, putative n=1 Tax=Theileria equi strain WA TaxID=1537102 RepID=L0B0V5_THEEQ|nr:26S proteasome subunit, putative [Theileria equi strain WA]AFZ81148.1 26S proteasome subunit, putative [Theileria equi strain WA]|eukprot:XP_004830814.1 26S proteasome subunit, putative [Theileria equi strain WA]